MLCWYDMVNATLLVLKFFSLVWGWARTSAGVLPFLLLEDC